MEDMKIYTIKEAAEVLGISIDYMRKLLIAEKIEGFKVGDNKRSHWRVKKEAILKYMAR